MLCLILLSCACGAGARPRGLGRLGRPRRVRERAPRSGPLRRPWEKSEAFVVATNEGAELGALDRIIRLKRADVVAVMKLNDMIAG